MALIKRARLARAVGGALIFMGLAGVVGTYFAAALEGGYSLRLIFGVGFPVVFLGVAMCIRPGSAPPVDPDDVSNVAGDVREMLAGLRLWEKLFWLASLLAGVAAAFAYFHWLKDRY